jgi:hypothetical protein
VGPSRLCDKATGLDRILFIFDREIRVEAVE